MVKINLDNKWLCGGSIIAKNWVLTAAHCMHPRSEVKYFAPEELHLSEGLLTTKEKESLETGIQPKKLAVKRIVVHEGYNHKPFLHDIALLELEEEIVYEKYIRPICLPPARGHFGADLTFYKPSETAIVAGWGAIDRNAMTRSGDLKQLETQIGFKAECQRKGTYYYSQYMMCAKSKKGEACAGDSGGPLMKGVPGEETVWTEIGIVSWAPHRICENNSYTYYTKVSYYVPWIMQHIGGGSKVQAGSTGQIQSEVRANTKLEGSAKGRILHTENHLDSAPNAERSSDASKFRNVTVVSTVLNGASKAENARRLSLDTPTTRTIVYFVFDQSARIGSSNFRKGVNLAKAITQKMKVTPKGHRVGAIVFNRNAKLVVDPMVSNSTDEVLDMLARIQYSPRKTFVNAALLKIHFSISVVEVRLGKKPRFLVFLFIDGKANVLDGATWLTNQMRYRHGAEIFAITATNHSRTKHLRKVVSAPYQEHVFDLRERHALQQLLGITRSNIDDNEACGVSEYHGPHTGGASGASSPWPWTVKISRKQEPEGVACGGSLIANTWVLTAASCLYSILNDTAMTPVLAAATADDGSTLAGSSIKRMVIHDRYRFNLDLVHDIALLELNEDLTQTARIVPACLPPAQGISSSPYKASKSAYLVASSMTDTKAEKSSDLAQIEMMVGSESFCYAKSRRWWASKGIMCAKSLHGEVCRAESGSPLMQEDPDTNSSWRQIGILTRGFISRKNSFSFYTDVALHVPWIRSHLEVKAVNAVPPVGSTVYRPRFM
ncbi:uncharacterized protein LOC144096661 isoform X2 [Amblyomma americanum]